MLLNRTLLVNSRKSFEPDDFIVYLQTRELALM